MRDGSPVGGHASTAHDRRPARPPARLAAFLATLWAGYLIGLSFVATPAKFLAPTLTLPVALDVGRATFHVSAVVETGLAGGLLAAAILGFGIRDRATGGALLVGALLAAQHLGLRPLLDARVAQVIAGEPPSASWHHLAWIGADAARILLLLAIAWLARPRADGSTA